MEPYERLLASATAEMEDFVSTLGADRVLDVYIGKESRPYRIPESTLSSMSDIFVKAIKYEHLGIDPPGTLRFSGDDETAWKYLLWWKMKGKVPVCDRNLYPTEVLSFVRSWILGDKYDIKEFQDDLMVGLLLCLQVSPLHLTTAKVAFDNMMPSSPLRILMAEEIAHQIRQTDDPSDFPSILSWFEGTVGFTAEIIEALDMYESCGKHLLKRERCVSHRMRFMLGERRWSEG